jgi:hypothetical protein
MTRTTRLVLALALAPAAVALYAADKDFWDQKPYTEWNEKEVERMTKTSPWAKTVVLGSGVGRGGDLGGTDREGGGFGGATISGGGSGGGGVDISGGDGGFSRRGGGGMGGGMGSPAPSLVIAWYSRPLRQAFARRAQLRNPETTREELDKILNYKNTGSIDILVMSSAPRGMGPTNPDVLQRVKDETFLLKKNKEKVPLQALMPPSGPGQPLVLRFPRQVEGHDVVTLEDKEIELVTRVGNNTIRTRFKLADMVINGQLEI